MSFEVPRQPPERFSIRRRVIWGQPPDSVTQSLTKAALALAASGLPVFPCNSDKKPIVEGGLKSATRDGDVIREMFVREGAALIGMPTGRASGRVVIDVDPRHGGDAWLSANQNRLPPTLTHATPSLGVHLMFRDPLAVEIRNSQGRIAPGVDVRGTGGYVIVPPSKGYTIKHNGPLADMPPWLVEACLQPEQPPPSPPRPPQPPLAGDGTPYGLKALEEECTAIHLASFGQQEMTLNNAALKIGSLVAAGELAESYALAELIAAGNAMPSEGGREPWRASQIEKKVRRALEDGKCAPRNVPPPIFADDQAQGDAAEPPPPGEETYSHFWRAQDGDHPCTPTGEECPWHDGRIYARVRTPRGTEGFVPKDELITAQGEDDEPPPATDAAGGEEPQQGDDRPGARTTYEPNFTLRDGGDEAVRDRFDQRRRYHHSAIWPEPDMAVCNCNAVKRRSCRSKSLASAGRNGLKVAPKPRPAPWITSLLRFWLRPAP